MFLSRTYRNLPRDWYALEITAPTLARAGTTIPAAVLYLLSILEDASQQDGGVSSSS